jgi:hypothetical protein
MTPAPSIQSTATRPPTATTFKPRVRRLGGGLYLVESATTPGLGHQATATSCGCTAGRYGKTCRHQRLVAALEPRFQAWYAQRTAQAQAAPAAGPGAAPAPGLDAQLAAAAQVLDRARRALLDTDERSDEYAGLLRQVDQAERAYAALDASAMRAA